LRYLVLFELPFDCAVKASAVADDDSSSVPGVLGPLPHAYAYGASHPGKLFEPSGKVPLRPQITAIGGYQVGSLVYVTIFYTDPGKDAKGFGFVGINGAGWAQENHPFSSPSYGIVGHDEISYPFNLACGTPKQYKSHVAAWIYDNAAVRSQDVQIALNCTPPPPPPSSSGRVSVAEGIGNDGLLDAFVVGADGQLYTDLQTSPGVWSGWSSLGGSWPAGDSVSVVANADGRLEAFLIGQNGQLYHSWQASSGSGPWSAWSSLGGSWPAGDSIGIASNSDGRLEAFLIGQSSQLYTAWQTSPGSGPWSAWASLGSS
jgi:hypothetical protein